MSTERQLSGRLLIVAAGIMFSRCFGLARDVVFAHVWGTGTALAAFVIAFTIPNLLRGLFGEGAMNAAFVPVFSETLVRHGRQRAWELACRFTSSLTVVLAAVVTAVMVVALFLSALPGAGLGILSLRLTGVLMPYGLLICLVAALAAVLTGLDHFAVAYFSQSLLNIFLIIAALGLAPMLGTDPEVRIYALVAAVLAAGIVQVLLHLAACACHGCWFRFLPDFQDPTVRRIGTLLAPVVLGAGVLQLNVVVDRVLAGYLGSVATTTLYYSQRLVYLPVGLFGVALSVVCMPAMSRAAAAQDTPEVLRTLRFSISQVLYLTLPCVALLYVARTPVVALLFQRGAFTADATAETAWTLLFYLWGIPAFAAAKVATTPFHANQDTRTPVRVALVCLGLNVVLNLVLMQFLRQGGLALSTAICSCVNVAALLWLLSRRFGSLGMTTLGGRVLRIVLASLLAAIAAQVLLETCYPAATAAATFKARAARALVPILGGGTVYLLSSLLLRCPELHHILAPLLAIGRKRRPQ